jgi:hypothetical protein
VIVETTLGMYVLTIGFWLTGVAIGWASRVLYREEKDYRRNKVRAAKKKHPTSINL